MWVKCTVFDKKLLWDFICSQSFKRMFLCEKFSLTSHDLLTGLVKKQKPSRRQSIVCLWYSSYLVFECVNLFLEEASDKCSSIWSSTLEMASWPLSETARYILYSRYFQHICIVYHRLSSWKDHRIGVLLKQAVFNFSSRKTSIYIPNLGVEFKI